MNACHLALFALIAINPKLLVIARPELATMYPASLPPHTFQAAGQATADNAIKAAGAKFTDPKALSRLLYFMMNLTASIEQGK